MAGSVNKVILVGHLGKDPVVTYTPSGVPMAKFTLATNEVFKDRSGEQKEHTEWHNIVAWNKLAEICGQYLTKGKLVYIEGTIRSRQWEDQAGNKRTAYDIIASRMQMLGARADSERPAVTAPATSSTAERAYSPGAQRPSADRTPAPEPPSEPPEITDEDVPF